jgi:hypothetical protein
MKEFWLLVGREFDGSNVSHYFMLSSSNFRKQLTMKQFKGFSHTHNVLNARPTGKGVAGIGIDINSIPRYKKQHGQLMQYGGISEQEVIDLAQPLIQKLFDKEQQAVIAVEEKQFKRAQQEEQRQMQIAGKAAAREAKRQEAMLQREAAAEARYAMRAVKQSGGQIPAPVQVMPAVDGSPAVIAVPGANIVVPADGSVVVSPVGDAGGQLAPVVVAPVTVNNVKNINKTTVNVKVTAPTQNTVGGTPVMQMQERRSMAEKAALAAGKTRRVALEDAPEEKHLAEVKRRAAEGSDLTMAERALLAKEGGRAASPVSDKVKESREVRRLTEKLQHEEHKRDVLIDKVEDIQDIKSRLKKKLRLAGNDVNVTRVDSKQQDTAPYKVYLVIHMSVQFNGQLTKEEVLKFCQKSGLGKMKSVKIEQPASGGSWSFALTTADY